MKVLTIISHTEHYKTSSNTVVGLGSTVTEINNLLEVFDRIYHIAMLHNGAAPQSALPYSSDKIEFIPIPAVGGPKLNDKISIIWQAPKIIKIIKRALKKSDYFQFRAPTGIGVFVIPYLIMFTTKKGWFKYAGNWNQQNPPLAYAFQKWMLKNQKRIVTINGKWPHQKKHCLTFENPCLTNKEIETGQEIINDRGNRPNQIDLCFVGRLEEEKGISLLIKALEKLSIYEKSKIRSIHIVGDGKAKNFYEEMVQNTDLDFIFHGFLSRTSVQNIYVKSQAIILPSASEGFPKVIAEAMNFGCIPIVSNVSGIANYVKHKYNGFLLETLTVEDLINQLKNVLQLIDEEYLKMISCKRGDLEKFTYAYYNKRIVNDILI